MKFTQENIIHQNFLVSMNKLVTMSQSKEHEKEVIYKTMFTVVYYYIAFYLIGLALQILNAINSASFRKIMVKLFCQKVLKTT